MNDESTEEPQTKLNAPEEIPDFNNLDAVDKFLFEKTLIEVERILILPIIKKAQKLIEKVPEQYQYHKEHARSLYMGVPWEIIRLIMFYRYFGDRLPEENIDSEVLEQRQSLVTKSKTEEFVDDCVIAAYFHDVGYKDGAQGHETRSAYTAGEQMRLDNYSEERIQGVKSAILDNKIVRTESGFAFKIPSNPIAALIMDADTANFGRIDNEFMTNLVAEELGRDPNDPEFLESTLQLMKRHKYYTESAKYFFSEQKAKNIQALEERIAALRTQGGQPPAETG